MRRFNSILEVPERQVMLKFRLIGLAIATAVGFLIEFTLGRNIFAIDPRAEFMMVPIGWLVIFYTFEWQGELELARRGVRTAGVIARKHY